MQIQPLSFILGWRQFATKAFLIYKKRLPPYETAFLKDVLHQTYLTIDTFCFFRIYSAFILY